MIGVLLDGIIFLCGINFIYSAYKLKKDKDLKRCGNRFVKPEKIKDTDGYIHFNSKWMYLSGILAIISSISGIIGEYVVQIETISNMSNMLFILVILTYTYKSLSTFSKFY